VTGVVVDLRGNGGGYLNAAVDVASLWLDKKVVVQEKEGDKVIDTLKTNSNPLLAGMKTTVLVDGGSASAS
jgi:carboxyl-terminal processing protease